MLNINTSNELARVCQQHGFTKRGKAFFRVHGDGVLQVIKFEYERCGELYLLYIGLFSMYGELEPQWFTSSGCIPRYCVTLLQNVRDVLRSKEVFGITYYDPVSPEEQLEILIEKGFPWLDSIDTQEKLLDGICYLESVENSVRWNDFEKVAPCLSTNQFDKAELVVCSILQQHYCARSAPHLTDLPLCSVFKPHADDDDDIDNYTDAFWTENDYAVFTEKFATEEDNKFLQIHKWLYESDHAAIEKYLSENYVANCKSAKFCVKNSLY